jgi:transposase
MKSKRSSNYRKGRVHALPSGLKQVNLHAAGIDIGAQEHYVCVPEGRAARQVRSFGTFTSDLERMADWLAECAVETVAMESTGVYWIAAFQVLERRGFKVLLVNARHVKNVPGRKTDMIDCQWLQQLHTFGLLRGSFRPSDPVCVLRSYLRLRDELIAARLQRIQHMQKALLQMNVQLPQVLSDVSGVSGMNILRAIVAGERDAQKLATMVDKRVRSSTEQIVQALKGDYREEHMFALGVALELYDTLQQKIQGCEERIENTLATWQSKVDLVKNPMPQPAVKPKGLRKETSQARAQREQMYRVSGVDLGCIEGIGVVTAQILISEIGLDMSKWPSEKHFTSWLGLCPDNRISGGKVLSTRTRRVVNRATNALRMAATTLERSQSALGAYFRRMKARLGPASAITCAAHKLARLVYRLLKYGERYVSVGLETYEARYKDYRLKGLEKAARRMGYALVPNSPAQGVS